MKGFPTGGHGAKQAFPVSPRTEKPRCAGAEDAPVPISGL